MLEIPLIYTQSSADFIQTIILDEVTVILRLYYNIRNQFFALDAKTNNYEIKGLKAILNYPIIHPSNSSFPELPGDFLINQVTNTTQIIDLNYDTFGNVFKLFYYSADEVQQWRSNNGLG